MFAVKSDRKFACFVKKSADHFVDYFIGLNVFPICLARSVLLFLENTLTVETTAIRENRMAPGIISESQFLVEMVCFPNSLFPLILLCFRSVAF